MVKKTYLLVSMIMLLILAAFVAAMTTYRNPASCAGQWTTCSYANANGGSSTAATLTSSLNKSGRWQSYTGITIPNGSIIHFVKVRADFWVNNATPSTLGFLNVRVSPDAGATWGPDHTIQGSTSEFTYDVDVTNDFAWDNNKLSNANFRVNATCYKQGTAINLTCRLDWIPSNVSYTPFNVSLSQFNPSSSTLNADVSESVVTNLTVTLHSNITQRVNLSLFSCPNFATCVLNTSFVYPNATVLLNVTTSPQMASGNYSVLLSSNGPGDIDSQTFNFNVSSSCTRAAPSVVAVPESQSGNPGDTLNYSVNVTNNDAAACGAANFTIGSANKTGFTQVYNSPLLINPGETGTATWNITSNSSVIADTYIFFVNATNQKTGSYATDNVSYVIPFDFALSIDPTSRNVNADVSENALANVTATLTEGSTSRVNLSVAGCPSFSVCNTTDAFLYPTATTVLNVTPSPKTPAGVYIVNVTARGPGHTYIESFTVDVASSCVYRAPQVSIAPNNLSGPLNATLTFVTTLTNIDNVSCTAGNFSLTTADPTGYNSSFHPVISGVVLGPGNSSQTNFTIMANAVLTPGDRTFTHTGTRTNGLQASDDAIVTYQPFDFAIELTPTEQIVDLLATWNASSWVNLTTLTSPTQRVNMSTVGCPPSANCSFRHYVFGFSSVQDYALPNDTLLFVANLTATPPGNYLINLTGAGDANTEVAVFNVTVV